MALTQGARFILTFMLLAVLIVVGAVFAGVFLASRGPSVEEGSVLWLRVPANLVERKPDDLFGQLVGQRNTVSDVVSALRNAKVDTRIRAVVLVPPLQQGLWGKVQEIRDAVRDYRMSGKPIVAHLEYGGGLQYYLATACDEIFLTPTSPLDLVGVASYELFARDALDTVGVYPDMLHAGNFKTAANVYTENTFTPFHREMSESLNRDLYDQLVAAIAEGRRMSPAAVRTLVDDGPFLPNDALSRGLVDGLTYEDELVDRLSDNDDDVGVVTYADYRKIDANVLGLGGGPSIAVVYAVGVITYGGGGVDVGGSEVIGSEAMVRAIRAARDDESIEAIILRIDSPGGAAVASDIIWREVHLARQDKPVIASMSDVAASGGYYLAMPADVIVAQPATLTGSIGVVGGKLALGGTFDKFGVTVETVADGQMADMNSFVTPYSDQARTRVQEQIDAVYEAFLTRVADNRSMTRDAVGAVAEGRVWTGQQARDVGLIDELGGLTRAVAIAKDRAGIDADQEVTLVMYPRPRSLLEVLSSSFAVRSGLIGTRWLGVGAPAARVQAAVTAPLRLFRPGEPLALMPFVYVP